MIGLRSLRLGLGVMKTIGTVIMGMVWVMDMVMGMVMVMVMVLVMVIVLVMVMVWGRVTGEGVSRHQPPCPKLHGCMSCWVVRQSQGCSLCGRHLQLQCCCRMSATQCC